MRRIRSRLNDSGHAALVASGVSLLLAVCSCVLLSHHLVPHYGLRIRPETSRYVMGGYDRSHTHIISIAAGDEPRFYDGSRLVENGMTGMEALLESWKDDAPSRTTVVLVADKAVSVGTVQHLADVVLSHGFNCNLGAVPSVE